MKSSKLLVLCAILLAGNAVMLGQDTPNLANGMPPQGSYDGGSTDTVNLMNGNLAVHIPLPVSVPQRGKLGIQYYLVVNAKTWIASGNPNTLTGQWLPMSACFNNAPTPSGPCGLGPLFVSTASFTMTRSYSKVWTDGQQPDYAVGTPDTLRRWDGASLAPNGGDTSGYRVISPSAACSGSPSCLTYTATIIDRNGTQYSGSWMHDGTLCSFDPGDGLPGWTQTTDCTENFAVSSVTDANGNVLSAPLGIPDIGQPHTNAPTVATHLASGSESSGCLTSFGTPWVGYLNYPAPNGATNQIKLCFGTYPQLSTNFSPSGIHQFQDVYSGHAFPGNYRPPVYLTNVILPDNTQWSIAYDSYGEITSLTTPTGASIAYSWTEAQFPVTSANDITSVSRAVHSRTVTDVNGNSFPWTYLWGAQASDGTMTHTVTDPAGNDTVHVFASIQPRPTQYPYNFKEISTVVYQGGGGSRTALKQVDTTWQINSDGGLGVPTDVKTTLFPSQKVTLSHTDYDPSSPTLGLVTSSKQYDWGQGTPGALLRETDTVYQWQKDSRYLTANLIDLPATTIIVSPVAAGNIKSSCPVDGAGTTKACMAETDYTYDEASYLTNYEVTVGALPAGTHVAAPNPVRGNLTTVSKLLNAGGSVVSHSNLYDTGEVYQQIDPLGHTTTHNYDLAYNGALSTKTCNAKSQCVSATYDVNTGLLASFTNANATQQASGTTQGDASYTATYSYDSMWRMTSAVSPADANGNHPQSTFSYPNPTTIQRLASITPTMNDSVTMNVDGFGHTISSQHAMPSGSPATVTTTYDGLGRAVSVTNPYFSTTDPTYGLTQTAYDAAGRPTTITRQDGSIATVSYPDNCTIATDEAGKQRKSCTDGMGRLVEVDERNPGVTPATNAAGSITINGSEQTANYQSASSGHGTVTIGGAEQSATVDPCYNPDITPPDGQDPPSCPQTRWDSGTVTITVNGHPDAVAYGGGDTSASVAAGLASAINNDSGAPVTAGLAGTTITLTAKTAGASTNYSVSTSAATSDPNDFGAASFSASPASVALTGGHDASSTPDTGTVTVTVNGTGYSTTYGANDTAGAIASRLAGIIGAGNFANATPSGGTINLTSKTAGPNGDYSLATSYTWNSGQFTSPSFTASTSGGSLTGGYNANDIANNPYVTLYAYDALGNLLRVDQKGSAPTDSTRWRTRLFTYDPLSRLLTAYNPESGTITYSYDANGNLLRKTSPAPNQTGAATQTISYCYDELNRPTGRAYSAQSCSGTQLPPGTAAASYTYDSGTNAIGKLTSFTDQAGSGSYTYDVLGRMATESRTTAGISKSMSYAYNLDGSLKTLTYPSGASVTYTPDSAGRMLSAVDTGNGINYVTGATYGPDSGLTGFVSGNTGGFAGITNAFSYNKRLQPINMSAASPGQTVFSIGYDFHLGNGTTGSDNGNVWGITNFKDNSRNQSFTYDPLNRLLSAQNAGTDCTKSTVNGKTEYWGNSYGYDAWGNLLQKTVTKCNAENLSVAVLANNQLTGYGFDAAGNMTSDPTDSVTSTYNPENRIATATKNGVTTTYTYDDDGNRVEKNSGGSGTLYWYMSPGIVAESDLAGNLQSEYVFFDGERVARKDFPGLAVSYYFSDHLKTASVITDAVGNIKSESDYYPWGGELQFSNNDSNHYKFTGKERDAETGLDYFGARYYSNGLGRFVSADWSATPIPVPYADLSDPQSLNLYTYVRNIPTTGFDPDGHAGSSSGDEPLGIPKNVWSGLEGPCWQGVGCYLMGGQQSPRSDIGMDIIKGSGKELGNEVRDLVVLTVQAGMSASGDDTNTVTFSPAYKASNRNEAGAMMGTSLILLLMPGGSEEAALAKSPKALKELVSVYRIVEDGRVVYVGISKDLVTRALQHGAKLDEIIGGLTRTQARAVEQVLIEHYGFEKVGGALRNKIASISPTRDKEFYKAAKEFGKRALDWIGYKF
jgi:RHS repeat-associated protein